MSETKSSVTMIEKIENLISELSVTATDIPLVALHAGDTMGCIQRGLYGSALYRLGFLKGNAATLGGDVWTTKINSLHKELVGDVLCAVYGDSSLKRDVDAVLEESETK